MDLLKCGVLVTREILHFYDPFPLHCINHSDIDKSWVNTQYNQRTFIMYDLPCTVYVKNYKVLSRVHDPEISSLDTSWAEYHHV